MRKSIDSAVQDIYSLRFLRFILVGSLGYGAAILIIYMLTEKLRVYYVISWIISWLLSSLLTFFINKHYTFTSKNRRFLIEICRYYLVNSSSLLFSLIGVFALVEGMHLHYLTASVFVSLVFLFYNFLLHKKWSFR